MMPKSAKGGGRNRSEKKPERYSVPITVQLAARLKAAAKGRADDAPLLLQATAARGATIRVKLSSRSQQDRHRHRCSIPDVTMYCLRHIHIVSMLLQNIPIRLVASLHNTSVTMIERHYSKYITEHSDDVSRKALLQHGRSATSSQHSRHSFHPRIAAATYSLSDRLTSSQR